MPGRTRPGGRGRRGKVALTAHGGREAVIYAGSL
jgi:hypothetical protein